VKKEFHLICVVRSLCMSVAHDCAAEEHAVARVVCTSLVRRDGPNAEKWISFLCVGLLFFASDEVNLTRESHLCAR